MAGFKRKRTGKSQKKVFRAKGRKGTTKKTHVEVDPANGSEEAE
jgi:hypothetical protein